MLNTLKAQVARLRLWTREKPKVAVPILGAVALLILVLISVLIAVMIQDDKPQVTTRQPEGPAAQVTITANGFEPATLVVKKGTKIIWTNSDQAMHQIYANPHPTGESLPGLKSEILNSTQTYEYTADTVGTYGYHDQLNPTTNGTLDVQN